MKPLNLTMLLLILVVISVANVRRLHAEYLFSNRHFIEAVRANPFNWRYHYWLGSTYYHTGQTRAAAAHYSITLRLFPYYFDAMNNLAVIYARHGKKDEAKGLFDAILKAWPGHGEAKRNLEVMEGNQG